MVRGDAVWPPMKARNHADPTDQPASERRYRELYENMPVMFFEMDDQGVVVSVNAFGAGQLGYVPEELVGRSVMNVFHEDDRAAVGEQFASLLKTDGEVVSWEFRKRRKDQSVLWVREAARAIRTEEGRTEVMVVCQDITDQKRAEEERHEAERLVRQLSVQLDEAQDRERRRIAVHLHDDVGQTLTAAQLKLAQIEPGAANERELQELKDLLHDAVRDTRSLTFELASPVLYELGLADALRSLCEPPQACGETEFRFDCYGDVSDVPERLAVPLYRIASELVFNVCKHAQAAGARVALRYEDGQVQLTVEDDGKGFDPVAARKPVAGQTGIGLFSIEQRVEVLGGQFEIRSEPGKGSCASVRVPTEPGPAGA